MSPHHKKPPHVGRALADRPPASWHSGIVGTGSACQVQSKRSDTSDDLEPGTDPSLVAHSKSLGRAEDADSCEREGSACITLSVLSRCDGLTGPAESERPPRRRAYATQNRQFAGSHVRPGFGGERSCDGGAAEVHRGADRHVRALGSLAQEPVKFRSSCQVLMFGFRRRVLGVWRSRPERLGRCRVLASDAGIAHRLRWPARTNGRARREAGSSGLLARVKSSADRP